MCRILIVPTCARSSGPMWFVHSFLRSIILPTERDMDRFAANGKFPILGVGLFWFNIIKHLIHNTTRHSSQEEYKTVDTHVNKKSLGMLILKISSMACWDKRCEHCSQMFQIPNTPNKNDDDDSTNTASIFFI